MPGGRIPFHAREFAMTMPVAPDVIAVIGPDQARQALGFDRLIPQLDKAFAEGATVPMRHHHYIPQGEGPDGVLLLMPAWQDKYLGVKIATIYPGNTGRALPGVYASYLLSARDTGRPLALIDGNQITARRTAATAALAASYLSRPDAANLLVVGAGRVACLLASAFRQVRPIKKVALWDVDAALAARLAASLEEEGIAAAVASSLEEAVRAADIVSCATLSTTPLVRGEWLRPGTHLDLIGSFTPNMREADDACFARAKVYVDAMDALLESGDLMGPLESGALKKDAIRTLAQLCGGAAPGRETSEEITVFKAVGTALADMAAGALVYESAGGQ
jgi:ornithine cyclodeaminase